MTLSVGVIGLGALGEPIAGLLLKAGFATRVCDVRREPVERLAKLYLASQASLIAEAGVATGQGDPRF